MMNLNIDIYTEAPGRGESAHNKAKEYKEKGGYLKGRAVEVIAVPCGHLADVVTHSFYALKACVGITVKPVLVGFQLLAGEESDDLILYDWTGVIRQTGQ